MIAILSAGVLAAMIFGSFASVGSAQDVPRITAYRALYELEKTESDEEFIRRISMDLRATAPTPAEIHFFLASKDQGKRQKLVDLFIQERQAKDNNRKVAMRLQYELDYDAYTDRLYTYRLSERVDRQLTSLQSDYQMAVLAAKNKAEVAKLTQAYLDSLVRYAKDNPENGDLPDAMLQIMIVYESQGKTVEAAAWRAKLLQEHPKSSAAARAK
jgi:hypothetical protein